MEIKNFKKAVIDRRTEVLKGNNKKTLFFKKIIIDKIIDELDLDEPEDDGEPE